MLQTNSWHLRQRKQLPLQHSLSKLTHQKLLALQIQQQFLALPLVHVQVVRAQAIIHLLLRRDHRALETTHLLQADQVRGQAAAA
jgi:hypothetical protein